MVDTLTEQQAAFIEGLRTTSAHACLRARAGTGKTTTLREAITQALPATANVLAVAFNKHIAQELGAKLPPNATCQTINSLGHRAWSKQIGRKLSLNQNKTYELVQQVAQEAGENSSLSRKEFGELMRLCDAARSAGMVPAKALGSPMAKPLIPDDQDMWERLAVAHDLDLQPKGEILSMAREVVRNSVYRAMHGEVDFIDQIYMPACFRCGLPRFSHILVDEAQDLGGLKHRLIEKLVGTKARLIIAGDNRQSIYGFAGAATDSLDRFTDAYDMDIYPLTQSFRCPQAVITEAQSLVPDFEPLDQAPEGKTYSCVEDGLSIHDLQQGDLILCRYNGPLVSTALLLIQNHIPAYMIGRDLGRGLKQLVNKLTNHQTTEIQQFFELLEQWRRTEIAKAHAKGDEDKIERTNDKDATINALIDAQIPDTDALLSRITHLFSRDSGKVALSTIHRIKGGEADRVIFLDHRKLPPERVVKSGDSEKLQQEYNLIYVAMTRARETLIYAASDNITRGEAAAA